MRRTTLQRTASLSVAVMPALIIGSLLYAAFFVKPHAQGVSVKPPVIERRDIFYSVAVPAPDLIWAAGNHGKIVRSNDSGKTWSRQASGVTTELHSIAAWDAQRAVAVGKGTVVLTADGGKTWTRAGLPQSVDGVTLLRVRTYADGVVWAVGEMGAVLSSSDFGATWRSAGTGEDIAWNDVSFVKDAGWLVGEFGRMKETRDGGASWKAVEGPAKSSLNSIYFRNENEGVALGTEGVMLHTRDGGTSWQPLPKVVEQNLFDVLWDGNRWVAVGDKGALLTASGSGNQWSANSVAAGTTWHTQIAGNGKRYVLAGYGVKAIELPEVNSSNPGEAK
ncbi:MAG: hypothetical protein JWR40_5282 [Massilia sp.]|nr:hypothetical protein [Massilia sp.]MDB5953028.1 hypothetical protein [Massilia sp.]